MSCNPQLKNLRKQIDVCDQQLLLILAKRMQIVQKIGQLKKESGLKPLDKNRWQKLLAKEQKQAAKLNLPPRLIKQWYELMHQYSLRIQK